MRTRRSKYIVLILALLAAICFFFYLLPIGSHVSSYLLKLRLRQLVTYLLVAIITSLSTISFQTIVGNRFLTPSVLGLESLYVLMQSIYLFFFWQWSATQNPNAITEFLVVMFIQCSFFFVVQPTLKKLLQKDFGTILLICMSLGTLFRSLSTFMQILMDPNEYDKLQSKLYASFQNANEDVIVFVAVLVLVLMVFLYRSSTVLDVFGLGKDAAKLLGVDVAKVQRSVLWAVVLLTSASTAMVGPLTFFGFMIANLIYLLVDDYRHQWLFTISSLLAFIILVIGQTIVERFFNYNVTISMIVELVGGAFFFYLLYKERKKS